MSDVRPPPPQQTLPSAAPTGPNQPVAGDRQYLLVREGSLTCALPLANVRETMRPLGVQAIDGMPLYVQGVSIIRGQALPVVRLGSLLKRDELSPPQRWVLLYMERRHVALAVEMVLGVVRLDVAIAPTAPPLLQEAQPELIAGIGTLDRELLLVLRSSLILPADVWAAVAAHKPGVPAW